MLKRKVTFFFILVIFIISCSDKNIKIEQNIKKIPEIKIQKTVKNGSVTGSWPDGSIKYTGKVKNFKKNGNWTYYYEDGKTIQLSGQYKNDLKTGNWNEYQKNGKKKIRIRYIKDKVKEKRIYHESGTPKFHINYRNGVKNGKYMEYDNEGKCIDIAWFKDDKRNGQTNLWYINGNKKAIGNYKEGKKDGKWKLYSQHGVIQSEGYYKNGEKTGLWKFFNERGKKIEEKKF